MLHEFATVERVTEALRGTVNREDVNRVIEVLWCDGTTTVRPLDSDGGGPFGRRIVVDASDLEKILDALRVAHEHHVARDTSNAALHLAREVRLSPLTSELAAALTRIEAMLMRPVPSD